MTGGLNGNMSLAGLLITVNVAMLGILWGLVNARFSNLEAAAVSATFERASIKRDVEALREGVAGLRVQVTERVARADKEHATIDARFDRIESWWRRQ